MKLPSTLRARPTMQMHRSHYNFALSAAALLLALAAPSLHAQDSNDGLLRRGPGPRGQQPPSALPPTQPTALPTPQIAPIAATPVAAVANERPSRRARVYFNNGLLEVRADNSSLLQVLHDISRATGMTITGGIVEQRIFGDYGPASPATVLATLIDGTGTNMLLQQDINTAAPVELVLTQRSGGPTPASPNGPGFDDSPFPSEAVAPPPAQPTPLANSQNQVPSLTPQPAPQPAPQPTMNPLGNPANQTPSASTLNTTNSVPLDSLPSPTTATPPPQGIVDTPNPPPPGSTSNANGTTSSTPESIYQQLLDLQKAKAAGATTAPVPTTPPATSPAPQL